MELPSDPSALELLSMRSPDTRALPQHFADLLAAVEAEADALQIKARSPNQTNEALYVSPKRANPLPNLPAPPTKQAPSNARKLNNATPETHCRLEEDKIPHTREHVISSMEIQTMLQNLQQELAQERCARKKIQEEMEMAFGQRQNVGKASPSTNRDSPKNSEGDTHLQVAMTVQRAKYQSRISACRAEIESLKSTIRQNSESHEAQERKTTAACSSKVAMKQSEIVNLKRRISVLKATHKKEMGHKEKEHEESLAASKIAEANNQDLAIAFEKEKGKLVNEVQRLKARLEKYGIALQSPRKLSQARKVELVDKSTETAPIEHGLDSAPNEILHPSPIRLPHGTREVRKLEKSGDEFYVHRYNIDRHDHVVEPLKLFLRHGKTNFPQGHTS